MIIIVYESTNKASEYIKEIFTEVIGEVHNSTV